MKTKDKLKKKQVSGVSFPKLHGRTRITLTDVKTGEKEVFEKDNLVTDAVADIFANNIYGAMNYTDITPLRDMFGGVFCFEQALNVSAVLPENDDDNKLIAHAGQTAHSSASTTRGNPNGALSEVIQDGKGFKFVWDFATSQGNGTISALALTHKYGGDIGLKPIAIETGKTLLTSSSNKTKILTNAASDFPLNFVIAIDLTTGNGLNTVLSGDTLTVNEVNICLTKQGINDEIGAAEVLDTHEVTLTRTFSESYAAVCTDGAYIYVIEPATDGGSTLNIDKVDMSTWTAAADDITDASLSLFKQAVDAGGDRPYSSANRTIVSDGSIYWRKSVNRTFYRINLTNTADIEELSSTVDYDLRIEDGLNEINNGLLVGKNFIINGSYVYPMDNVRQSFYESIYGHTPLTRWIKSGGNYFVCGFAKDEVSINTYAAVGFPTCYLATIQNLGTAVTKTNDKTMQIEYSIMLDE